ncbi:WD40-repeat-containing domain protein [Gorgonomyces haynaldii]|nr:WD40-repeat-containing domain protein [Gorgonomyces haynaldii]
MNPFEPKKRPKSRRMSCNVQGSLNSLSASPDGRNVVVCGRDTLKILRIGDQDIQESVNLRAGFNVASNTNFSSNDVRWAQSKNIIVTAAASGAVLVWDVLKSSTDKLERVIIEHSRSVNRICFHPTEHSLLLSASQDGTMKLWDLRTKSASRHTMRGKAESVRDIAFNPAGSYEFIAAFENGCVQKWDIRNPSNLERLWNAHSGLALTVDWQQDGSLFASGGRDKALKIWDPRSESKKPISIMNTIAPISRAKWRPGYNSQIATASLSFDSRIHVWDMRRPFIAKYCINDHTKDTTGICWADSDLIWSCSKDATFKQHDMIDAYLPAQMVPQSTVAWSPNGEICFSVPVHDHTPRKPSSPGTLLPAFTKLRTIQRDLEQETTQATAMCNSETFDPESFVFLALNYTFESESVFMACEQNGSLAMDLDMHITAQTWRIIQMLFGSSRLEPVNLTKSFGHISLEEESELDNQNADSSSDYSETELLGLRTSKPAEFHTKKSKRSKDAVIPIWNPDSTVFDLLDYFAEEGNVQMCVAISSVLKNVLLIPQDRLEHWTAAYIALLRKFKLWNCATEIINRSSIPSIQSMNGESTTIYTGCGSCNSGIVLGKYPTWACEKCKALVSTCSYCRQQVRGAYSWCQVCSHGGHLSCLMTWFKNHTQCPSGCMHDCSTFQ